VLLSLLLPRRLRTKQIEPSRKLLRGEVPMRAIGNQIALS
jgi:hypothetical protein